MGLIFGYSTLRIIILLQAISCIRNKSVWRFQVVWRAAVGDILPRIRSISRPKQPGSHGVGRFRLSLRPSARLSNLGMQCHDDLLGTGPRRSAQVSNHHRPTDQMYRSQLHLVSHTKRIMLWVRVIQKMILTTFHRGREREIERGGGVRKSKRKWERRGRERKRERGGGEEKKEKVREERKREKERESKNESRRAREIQRKCVREKERERERNLNFEYLFKSFKIVCI